MIGKNLLVLFSFTLILVASVFLKALFFDSASVKDAQIKSVKLTHLADLSLSVFWYEPRVSRYEVAQYDPYPEMPPINSLSFVYRAR